MIQRRSVSRLSVFWDDEEIPSKPGESAGSDGGSGVTIEMLKSILGRKRARRGDEDVAVLVAALEADEDF